MSPAKSGVRKKKKMFDSQRGSHSARSWAKAMGRIQGLIPKIISITAQLALGTMPHTTSVLVDFSSVDERHDAQGTLVVISINYIEDYRRRFPWTRIPQVKSGRNDSQTWGCQGEK
jgi:hypothetical protein